MTNTWYTYPYDKETKALLNELFGNLPVNVTDSASVKTSEDKENFVITAALPGAKKEDIKISAKDNVLTVTYKPEKPNQFASSFSRTWRSTGLNVDALTATYTDGILTVTVPHNKKVEHGAKTFVVAQLDKTRRGAYTVFIRCAPLISMQNHKNTKREEKYKIGDLVQSSRGIVVKIHDKADVKKNYYLVHYIDTGEQHWASENDLDEFFNSEVFE